MSAVEAGVWVFAMFFATVVVLGVTTAITTSRQAKAERERVRRIWPEEGP